jgi:hypothetical protein
VYLSHCGVAYQYLSYPSDTACCIIVGFIDIDIDIDTGILRFKWLMEQKCFKPSYTVAYPGIFVGGGSAYSVKDRGQRERGSGGSSPIVRGSAQFANE